MTRLSVVPFAVSLTLAALAAAAPVLNGTLPGPLPLFPADNWWNVDVSAAPVDPMSAAYITWIGPSRGMHPDLGGDVSPGSDQNYGFSYAVVDGTQPLLAVDFSDGYPDECDGVDHTSGLSFPFYPIPTEAITQPHWVEGGDRGNVDLRCCADRHILVADRDNRFLYELWNCWYDGTAWRCGSGAFFDMNTNNRRPEGWTSADAAGLAILPGLIRYDEVFGLDPILHAFRMTLRTSCGHVFPASHETNCNDAASLPMGARLRLKSTTDISGFAPEAQKIFRAMMSYGLVMADNGSDMYVSGTYDNRWDNGVLNPAFAAIHASDFEVVELGWQPAGPSLWRDGTITDLEPVTPPLNGVLPLDAGDAYMTPVVAGAIDASPPAGCPLVLYALSTNSVLQLVRSGTTVRIAF